MILVTWLMPVKADLIRYSNNLCHSYFTTLINVFIVIWCFVNLYLIKTALCLKYKIFGQLRRVYILFWDFNFFPHIIIRSFFSFRFWETHFFRFFSLYLFKRKNYNPHCIPTLPPGPLFNQTWIYTTLRCFHKIFSFWM